MSAIEPGRAPSVLIVDGTPDNRLLLSELLRPLYRIQLAADGAEALAIAQGDNPPDIILLDVMMPGTSGFNVCRQLKATQETRDIPVIFLTTLNATEDETRGWVLGAVDYVTKPVNPPALLVRVGTHLRLKAVADVDDALISSRVYKKGMPHEEAAAFFAARGGIDFDPDIVDAFVELQGELQAIDRCFHDGPEADRLLHESGVASRVSSSTRGCA